MVGALSNTSEIDTPIFGATRTFVEGASHLCDEYKYLLSVKQ